jgi:hypothetical protein
MDYLWILGILIILLTITLLLFLKYYDIHIDENYKYLSAAIGLSGFTFTAMGDGLFI